MISFFDTDLSSILKTSVEQDDFVNYLQQIFFKITEKNIEKL